MDPQAGPSHPDDRLVDLHLGPTLSGTLLLFHIKTCQHLCLIGTPSPRWSGRNTPSTGRCRSNTRRCGTRACTSAKSTPSPKCRCRTSSPWLVRRIYFCCQNHVKNLRTCPSDVFWRSRLWLNIFFWRNGFYDRNVVNLVNAVFVLAIIELNFLMEYTLLT